MVRKSESESRKASGFYNQETRYINGCRRDLKAKKPVFFFSVYSCEGPTKSTVSVNVSKRAFVTVDAPNNIEKLRVIKETFDATINQMIAQAVLVDMFKTKKGKKKKKIGRKTK